MTYANQSAKPVLRHSEPSAAPCTYAAPPEHAAPCEHAARAPRLTLLIRAAKLVTSHGEFVCVIRDISQTGVEIRLFHHAPKGDPIELHMPSGRVCEVRKVRRSGNEVAYEFVSPIDLDQFIEEATPFPKRGLRLGLVFPVRIKTAMRSLPAIVTNFSQQGACIECEHPFAIDQGFCIQGDSPDAHLGLIEAKVRWRRDASYGVVFEDTLTLADFARFAARVQCPALLRD